MELTSTITAQEIEEAELRFQPQLLKAQKGGKFAGLFTSDKDDWGTPRGFFDALNREFNFDVDVCANLENRKVDKFFSVQQDAFRLQWHGNCWNNPPYGRGIDRWLKKSIDSALHGSTVVCLIAARTDTNAWFNYARLGEVRFLKGRLKFELSKTDIRAITIENILRKKYGIKERSIDNSAPFPSALIIYRPGLPRSTSYWHYKETLESGIYSATRLE